MKTRAGKSYTKTNILIKTGYSILSQKTFLSIYYVLFGKNKNKTTQKLIIMRDQLKKRQKRKYANVATQFLGY